eukprot:64059-Alexandrium_andersonii.AAC.1
MCIRDSAPHKGGLPPRRTPPTGASGASGVTGGGCHPPGPLDWRLRRAGGASRGGSEGRQCP